MNTLARLGRYFRPLRRTIVVGVVLMALYALFSGASVGLILPIVDQVFLRSGEALEHPLPVADGLRETARSAGDAWNAGGSLNDRFTAAREAGVQGLQRILEQAAPQEILLWLCIITVIAVLCKVASEYGRKVAFVRVEQGAAEGIRRDLFGHIIRLPLGTSTRLPTGQLVSRVVSDIEQVRQYTINTAASFVHNLLQVLVYLGITIWASPRLALVSLVLLPPVAILSGRIASKLKRRSGMAQARIADLTGNVSETVGAMRLVKGFGTEGTEELRFGESARRYRYTVVRLLSLDVLAAPLSEFWGVAIGVSVLFFGGQLVLSPDAPMTAGRFFVFFLALVSMIHPLKGLSGVINQFQRGRAAAERVFEILDMPAETDPPGARPVAGLDRGIEFENVDFFYRDDRPVLRQVRFEAPAGTTTALVGPSGAGKSTLVDLIPRFYRPTGGRILWDGQELEGLKLHDLRDQIGIVSQETLLFDASVAYNIAYGSPDATREAVIEAARVANADGFIREMPEGYDTQVGERGVLLSGGQRQRIAIARAILRDPAVLILDEATSSLDTESERLVQEAIERLRSGRTTFVIAHRLSTILEADRILVLDEGAVVQQGIHTELVDQPGMYRRLYQLQFRGESMPVRDHVDS